MNQIRNNVSTTEMFAIKLVKYINKYNSHGNKLKMNFVQMKNDRNIKVKRKELIRIDLWAKKINKLILSTEY